jgi:hypothetical protein
VLLAPFVFVILLQTQPQVCTDVSSCRHAALEAKERKDFETFHDLAWLAYRKGRADDAELMLMVARAQSLSGRPGDAIVMLQRLAARGVATDAATSEDFEAVRSHPKWSTLNAAAAPTTESTKAPAGAASKPPATENPKAPTREARKAPAREVPKAPAIEESKAPAREVPKAPAIEESKAPAREVPKAPAIEGARAPSRDSAPLSFTTLLSPTAVAYDGVSKRYLIADRQARRIAVVDENTGQVSTLAGALAKLRDIDGIAIDTRQGDLWVVTSSDEGMALSRLQLISGRELGAARITGVKAPIVSMAFVHGAGLVVSDRQGDIYKLQPSGTAQKVASLEYVPTAIAADPEGTLYVAAGGPRIARFGLTPFRRLGLIDVEPAMLTGMPFAVTKDRIHLLVPAGGAYEIRTIKK